MGLALPDRVRLPVRRLAHGPAAVAAALAGRAAHHVTAVVRHVGWLCRISCPVVLASLARRGLGWQAAGASSIVVVLELSGAASVERLLALVGAAAEEAVAVLGAQVLERQRQPLRGLRGREARRRVSLSRKLRAGGGAQRRTHGEHQQLARFGRQQVPVLAVVVRRGSGILASLPGCR